MLSSRGAVVALTAVVGAVPVAAQTAARRAWCADLAAIAEHHVRDKAIPGIWLAVLDVDAATGAEWSWSRAVGTGVGGTVATVDDVHRVASLGKLVTATAAMVLVERGRLELDAPVRRYLPEFMPGDDRAAELTVRQLLTHRSGITRGYGPDWDQRDHDAPRSPAATVEAIGRTELLFSPGSATAYSNPAYTVLGAVLEKSAEMPFARLTDELVLVPLQMRSSAFGARPDLVRRTTSGRIWTLDGREIATPTGEFDLMPAVGLYSTVGDLLRFARSWCGGDAPRVLSPTTQTAMRQNASDDGFALGFAVGSLDGAFRIGLAGSAPGTACELAALPELGLAAVAVVGLDGANAIASQLVDRALTGMVALRRGAPLPGPIAWPQPLGIAAVRALTGRYGASDEWFDLRPRGDDLLFDPCQGVATVQRADGDRLVADDACAQGGRVITVDGGGRVWDGYGWFVPKQKQLPPPCPPALSPLIGEYGPKHQRLVVYEDEGQLGVLLHWHLREQPVRIGTDVYEFEPGVLGGETLRFLRDDGGRVVAAVCANVRLERCPDPVPGGFRIERQGDLDELRRRAAASSLPAQPAGLRAPDLVALSPLSPTLKFDIRYATADNFLGVPVYDRAAPALQRPAAEALLRVHEELAAKGYGLCVFDAYRPWSVTKVFWDATPEALRDFVADPSKGSRHNRGCAVDLSLYELATGALALMPSDFDEFTERAYPDWPGGTGRQRYHRDLLRAAMEAQGFTVYEHEWWHFDYQDWRQYPVLNEPLRW